MTLALTSQTVPLRDISDLADTLLAQRLSEIAGVGQVSVQGGSSRRCACRPTCRLAAYGMSLEDLRPRSPTPTSPAQGRARRRASVLHHRRQRPARAAEAYRTLVIAYRNGAPVLLRDVAEVIDGMENAQVGAWYQGEPAVVIDIQRQPGANSIETVERIQAELPRLQRSMPAAPS